MAAQHGDGGVLTQDEPQHHLATGNWQSAGARKAFPRRRFVVGVASTALVLSGLFYPSFSEARELRPGQQKVRAIVNGDSRRSFPSVAATPLRVRLPLDFGDVDMDLIPTEVFTEDAAIWSIGTETKPLPRPASIYFVGSSADLPSSRAYFALMDGAILGLFETRDTRYLVEPYKLYDERATSRDLVVTPAQFSDEPLSVGGCGGALDQGQQSASAGVKSILGDLLTSLSVDPAYALPVPTGNVLLAKVNMVADYYYYHRFGDNAQAVANWLGMLVLLQDPAYLRDLGITLRIARLDIFTTATQSNSYFPLGISAASYTSRCADYRTRSGQTWTGYAVTQCIRGSEYSDAYVGYAASVGDLCGAGGSDALTGLLALPGAGMNSILLQVELMAHENGHVFGAIHITDFGCGSERLSSYRCDGVGQTCSINADCPSSWTCQANGQCQQTGKFCSTNADCAWCAANRIENGYVMWKSLDGPFLGLPMGQCALTFIQRTIAGNGPYGSSATSCLQVVHCGDVNRDTAVTASDALAALQEANCTSNCAYDGLADVYPPPPGTPDGTVTQNDGNLILQAAIGSATLTTCGNFPPPYTP